MNQQESILVCMEYIMNIDEWDKIKYQEFWKRMEDVSEESYGEFSAKLIPGFSRDKVRGIRLPILRKFAAKIAKGNLSSYLIVTDQISETRDISMEEKLLQGFVIGHVKEYTKVIAYVRAYIPKIDNWSVCDSFCSSLKITKNYKKEMYEFIKGYIYSNQEFEQRFAYVMFLNYYIETNDIDDILNLCNRADLNGYYVKMAVAWLLSICYLKYPEKTLLFLQESQLDLFTYNKAIQKTIESTLLTKEDKVYLKTLKRAE